MDYDSFGNLVPYEEIEIGLLEFENDFVNIYNNSNTRKNIYYNYTNYLNDFIKEITSNWFQLINGSYTTNKINPNDIDLVNFIYFNNNLNIEKLIKFITKGGSKDNYLVDGYFVTVYDKDDERYEDTINEYNYWKKWFGHDRKNNPKGIIKLKLNF